MSKPIHVINYIAADGESKHVKLSIVGVTTDSSLPTLFLKIDNEFQAVEVIGSATHPSRFKWKYALWDFGAVSTLPSYSLTYSAFVHLDAVSSYLSRHFSTLMEEFENESLQR